MNKPTPITPVFKNETTQFFKGEIYGKTIFATHKEIVALKIMKEAMETFVETLGTDRAYTLCESMDRFNRHCKTKVCEKLGIELEDLDNILLPWDEEKSEVSND